MSNNGWRTVNRRSSVLRRPSHRRSSVLRRQSPHHFIRSFISTVHHHDLVGFLGRATNQCVQALSQQLRTVISADKNREFHVLTEDGGDRKSTRLNSSHIPLSRMP